MKIESLLKDISSGLKDNKDDFLASSNMNESNFSNNKGRIIKILINLLTYEEQLEDSR